MRKIESENNTVELKTNETNKTNEVKVSDKIKENKTSELHNNELSDNNSKSRHIDTQKESNEISEKTEKMFDDLYKCYEKEQNADFSSSLQENSNEFKDNFMKNICDTLNNNKEGISDLKNNIKEQSKINGLNENQFKNNPWVFVVIENDLGKTYGSNSFTNRLGDLYASNNIEKEYLEVNSNSQKSKEQSFANLTPNQKEIIRNYANNMIDKAKLSNEYIMKNYPIEENSLSKYRADSIIKLNNKIIDNWKFVNNVNTRGAR